MEAIFYSSLCALPLTPVHTRVDNTAFHTISSVCELLRPNEIESSRFIRYTVEEILSLCCGSTLLLSPHPFLCQQTIIISSCNNYSSTTTMESVGSERKGRDPTIVIFPQSGSEFILRAKKKTVQYPTFGLHVYVAGGTPWSLEQ